MDLPKRKPTRLKDYDYSSPGAYFITICTKDRKELLSKIIVGTGVLDCPHSVLTDYGKIVNKHLVDMTDFYDDIKIDKFVVMPNHIHLLLSIKNTDNKNGPSETPVPTNSLISKFISTFKRFCNKEYGNPVQMATLSAVKKIVFTTAKGRSKFDCDLFISYSISPLQCQR